MVLKRRIPLTKTKKEMFIGIGLGRLRNERGWTQEKLAHESGLNTRFIQRLEYDDSSPSGTTLSSLANAFEMRPWEFLKNIDDDIIYKVPEKKKPKKRPKS
jgi:transcriptional regulator with XRE-family HTH domain